MVVVVVFVIVIDSSQLLIYCHISRGSWLPLLFTYCHIGIGIGIGIFVTHCHIRRLHVALLPVLSLIALPPKLVPLLRCYPCIFSY